MSKVAESAFQAASEVVPNGVDKDLRSMNGISERSRALDDGYAGMSRSMSVDDRAMSVSSTMPRYVREAALSRESLLGPRRPQPHKIWKKKYVKLLVVGDSGLGKTTLIQTLLTTPGERLNVHDGSSTPSEQFKADPDSLLSTVQWKDEEDRTVWLFQVQDTPGYGDDLYIWNHINMVLAYIEQQNRVWLDMEQSKHREVELLQAPDPRVDLVLYCLPPHRLRAVDLRYMYELSRVVPILPVVTKADTMTIKEAMVFRQEVFSRLLNPNLATLTSKIEVLEFERDTLQRAGVQEKISGRNFPFLVVASNDVNSELDAADPPVFWPERCYNWGTAEAFNTTHSDLFILRALLLKEALEEISQTKRMRYEKWRRKALSRPQWGKKLLKLALWTVGPIALALQLGQQGYGLKDLPKVAKHTRRWLHASLDNVAKDMPVPSIHLPSLPTLPALPISLPLGTPDEQPPSDVPTSFPPEPELPPPPPTPVPVPEKKKTGWF